VKLIVSLLITLISTTVIAVGPPVPEEFVGIWVPIGSTCKAKDKLQITKNNVSLFNGTDNK